MQNAFLGELIYKRSNARSVIEETVVDERLEGWQLSHETLAEGFRVGGSEKIGLFVKVDPM